MEPETGGRWRFLVTTADGVETGFQGAYREVTAPERVVQTFEDLGDQTRVTTVSVFHSTSERDGMLGSGIEGGLKETYERLDAVLARG